MKKKIITTLTVLAGFIGLQQAEAQTTFGIRAGVNFQNITGEDATGRNLDYKLKTGFNVGLNAEIPIAPDYFIQPGVLFTQKGAKPDAGGQINLSYIDVPVNFLYKPALGAGKMLLGFGPYVGFGIGGKVEYPNGSEMDVEFEKETASSGHVFKGMDAGANFLAGYEFNNKFSFQLNSQLGLTKINPKFTAFPNDESSWKNTGFGVSVGYRF